MRRSGASYDAATTAWAAAVVTAGGTVSDTQKTRVNTLIVSLKASGAWSLLDRLWLYASENATTAKVDLVGLASHTVSGTPTFTANTGYQQGATADYIDTGFNLSTATNYTQNSASISVYVQSSRVSSGNFTAYGAQATGSGSQSTMHPFLSGNIFWSANNSGNAFDSVANPSSNAQGFYTINRSTSSGAGADDLYKNSVTTPIGTGTTTSIARPNLNMFVMGQNVNGTNTAPSAVGDRIAMFAMGASLGNATAIAQFQTDINTYMTAVGASVY